MPKIKNTTARQISFYLGAGEESKRVIVIPGEDLQITAKELDEMKASPAIAALLKTEDLRVFEDAAVEEKKKNKPE
jgi:hypothetical protein